MFSLLRDPDTTKFVLEFILDTPNGRRSVARLARTCKALQEPSLAVLWKELDSLNPLLYTMPTHLFKRAKRPGLGFVRHSAPHLSFFRSNAAYRQRHRRKATGIDYFCTVNESNDSPTMKRPATSTLVFLLPSRT